jgi:hypothetical protein
VAIELKYPRGGRTGISPDTMTLGEILRDFLRLAAVAAEERWATLVLDDRLSRYVESACRRHGLSWTTAEGGAIELPADRVAGLPATATKAIGVAAVAAPVTATCAVAERVDDSVSLYAYRVDPVRAAAASPLTVTSPAVTPRGDVMPLPRAPAAGDALSDGTREGARREIVAAARAVVAATGRDEFTMPQVIAEMRRHGTGYAEATIRTMISSHLCAQAAGDGVAGYTDITRIGRGVYRLTSGA